MSRIRYLVTGTGRCGTVFMARLLTSLGVPCAHETIFQNDGIDAATKRMLGITPLHLSGVSMRDSQDWLNPDNLEAESSYMAAPFLNHDFLMDSLVIHVVRHPVKVVNSFCNYLDYFQSSDPTNAYEAFIYNHIPELRDELTPYDRGCLYYVRWNEMIERNLMNRGYLFHRIEEGIKPILEFLEIEEPEEFFKDKKANTFEKPCAKFSVKDIEQDYVRETFTEIGNRYGYSMLSENLLV